MKYLFLLAVLLIGYGSLYPFDIREDPAPLRTLLDASTMSRGDLLGNVALFLPFGYLGMVAWRRPPRPLRLLLVVLLGALYGVLLQWAQLYIPSRDPALRDAGPNVLGTAIGALAGATPLLDVRRVGHGRGFRAAPWVLISLWMAYRLVPFVPSIDLQEWKDSVKPLLVWSPFPWVAILRDAAAWAAVACLWAAAPVGRLTVRWLPALAIATFGLEVLIVDNGVSPANVVGAGLGIALATLFARRPGPVAGLLAAAILVDGLRAGAGEASGRIEWIPFGGFLQGSMFVNAQSFFEKAFLYGALVWLGREAGLRLALAAAGAAGLLAGIEAAQAGIPGRSAEVTDPLLALLVAVFLAVADPPCPPDPSNPLQSGRARKEDL